MYVQPVQLCQQAHPCLQACAYLVALKALLAGGAANSEHAHKVCALASQAEEAALQRFRKELSRVCGRVILRIERMFPDHSTPTHAFC